MAGGGGAALLVLLLSCWRPAEPQPVNVTSGTAEGRGCGGRVRPLPASPVWSVAGGGWSEPNSFPVVAVLPKFRNSPGRSP